MKRLSLVTIAALIFSMFSFQSSVAQPVKKSERVVINFESGSSDMEFEDIQNVVRIGALVRADNGFDVVVTRKAFNKKVGATTAQKKLTNLRLRNVASTAKAGLSSASFPNAEIATYVKANAPKRNRVVLVATWTLPAPTVTTVSPDNGPILGGTSVTITGTNFINVTAVTFGGVAATSYLVNTASRITAIAPARSAGTVDIAVTTAGGLAIASGSFTYREASITSISPTTGSTAGGTSVTITGANLEGASALTFGGVAATSFTVNSPTQITAITPARSAGTVTVSVVTPAGSATSPVSFTYLAPSITSISPSGGSINGGNSVLITGNNLTGSSAVSFGGVPATSFTINSNTQITAVAPARPAGPVTLSVTTPVGVVNSSYTYYALPSISSLTPITGSSAGGTSVVISGSNFVGITAVTFGGTAATSFTVNSANQITAVAPARVSGAVLVQVSNPAGAATSPSNFTYFAPPTITSISPTTGSNVGGTSVVITGTNFTDVSAVNFGSTAATSFTVNSATQITALSPVGSIGTVTLTVTGPGGSATTSYTYSVSAPTITALTPASGSTVGGNTVVITGTNLLSATSVTFGGVAATSFTVNSATQITAIAPARSAGAVIASVTTPGGSATFTYTYSTVATITSFTPITGTSSGGTSVVITGTNFTGATSVTFGGVAASSFTVNSATQITAVTPARIAGGVTVDVITPGGVARAAEVYTYIAGVPTITSLTPTSGTTAGGTTVTITGTNLFGTTLVQFDTSTATILSNTPTQLVVTTSARDSAGAVNLSLTTAGGTATSVAAFTYLAPPVISSVSFTLAGSTVTATITGTDFIGTSSVTLNGAVATITSTTATQVVATITPAPTAGNVAVVLTNNVGVAQFTATYTP